MPTLGRLRWRWCQGKSGVLGLLLLSVCWSRPAPAQWRTQAIPLQAGWNAVYLEVQPQPAECDAVFASLPQVESAWRYNRRFTTLQFDLDPNQMLSQGTDWLVWLPAAHPQSFLCTLHTLTGGQAYLVRCSAAVTWQLKGAPVLPQAAWIPDDFNFIGFQVNPAGRVSFADYFALAPNLAIYRPAEAGGLFELNPDGSTTEIVQPARAMVQRGKAYWVKSETAGDYAGPLRVATASGQALDFDAGLPEQILSIANTTTSATMAVTIRAVPSESAPAGQAPVAGDVPLSYYALDLAGGEAGWRDFPAELSRTLAPRQSWALRLAPRVRDLGAAGRYQGLLEVSDAGGYVRAYVPVRVKQ